jgi:NitT/TauT family transport system substrate-binding protein
MDDWVTDRRGFLKGSGIAAAGALLGGSVLAACGTGKASTSKPGSKLPSVTFSRDPSNVTTEQFASLAAVNLGLYTKYGVSASPLNGTTTTLPTLLLKGTLGILEHGSAGYTLALQGQPVKIILGLGNTDPYVLASRTSITSIDQLKGKTFGAADIGSGSVYALALHCLAKANLTAKDVRFVELQVSDAVAAMAAGRVDAYLLTYGAAALAKTQSSIHVLDAKPADGFALKGYRSSVVLADFIKSNPEAVQGYVTSLIAAQRALANRSTFVQQVQAVIPGTYQPAELDSIFAQQTAVGFASVNGGINPDWISANLDYYKQQVQSGSKAANVSVADLLDTSFAKAALDKLGVVQSTVDTASWYKK